MMARLPACPAGGGGAGPAETLRATPVLTENDVPWLAIDQRKPNGARRAASCDAAWGGGRLHRYRASFEAMKVGCIGYRVPWPEGAEPERGRRCDARIRGP
jgi:hypothetical protein